MRDWGLWYRFGNAEMLLNPLAGFDIGQVLMAHQQIHAVASTAGLVLTAAFVAVPRAAAVLVIKAVAILAAA